MSNDSLISKLLEQLKAATDELESPEDKLDFVERVRLSVEQHEEDLVARFPKESHIAQLQNLLLEWFGGEVVLAAVPPSFGDPEGEEMDRLLAQTQIDDVTVGETDDGVLEVRVRFTIGEFEGYSLKRVSEDGEELSVELGPGDLIRSEGPSLEPEHINADGFTSLGETLGSELPTELLFIFLYVVAFDAELFVDWTPDLGSLDLSSWPPRLA